MYSKNNTPNEWWKNFLAGMAGGAISTGIFHPFDLIKIRWQVYESASLKLSKSRPLKVIADAPAYRPNYKSLLDTFSSVYRKENGFKGLYRGLAINTISSGTAWGKFNLI